jgi:hypothetical protein
VKGVDGVDATTPSIRVPEQIPKRREELRTKGPTIWSDRIQGVDMSTPSTPSGRWPRLAASLSRSSTSRSPGDTRTPSSALGLRGQQHRCARGVT